MKIKPEHLEHMTTEMRTTLAKTLAFHGAEKVASYREQVSPKRFRWDLARAAGLIPFITGVLYPYINDTHIDTALRHIISELDKEH